LAGWMEHFGRRKEERIGLKNYLNKASKNEKGGEEKLALTLLSE